MCTGVLLWSAVDGCVDPRLYAASGSATQAPVTGTPEKSGAVGS